MTVKTRQLQEASPGITLWRRIADELAQDIARGGYAGGEASRRRYARRELL